MLAIVISIYAKPHYTLQIRIYMWVIGFYCNIKLNMILVCENIVLSISSLQKRGCSGCVFLGRVLKNAAQNCIKPRFLKTGLKDKSPAAFS